MIFMFTDLVIIHYSSNSLCLDSSDFLGIKSYLLQIMKGEIPDIGDGGDEGSKLPCHVCTYARILRDLHMYPKT